MYDILLKNALVVDPSQKLNGKTSVAVREGKIAAIDEKISEDESLSTFDLDGKIVVPGLIDMHCHIDSDFSFLGLPADEIGVSTGVTLLCDAGTAGCANFSAFRKILGELKPKSDIFYFVNIGRAGLISMPEISGEQDVDFEKSRAVIEENREYVKGVKLRITDALTESLGLRAVETAKKLAEAVGMPLMLHVGENRPRKGPKDPLDELSRASVALMEKGDILSHYLTAESGGLILEDGTIYPELEQAEKRGVVLDSCHGSNHFSFNIARHALARGMLPTVITSDMSTIGHAVVQSIPVIMSKFLLLGLSLEQVVRMTTINPASVIKEDSNRGTLQPGRDADITIIERREGRFRFKDRKDGGVITTGEVLLEPYMVFKKGRPYPAWSRYRLPLKNPA